MQLAPTTVALLLAGGGAVLVVVTKQSSVRGAIAGMVVATISILGLGPGAIAPLATFVLGGGALTRAGETRKRSMGVAEPNRGTRGSRHVAAKLAIPALVALGAMITGLTRELAIAYTSGLAGALADTAGTEAGPLGHGAAFGIRDGRIQRVEHGSQGAVSVLGLVAAFAGAAAVAAGAKLVGLVDGPGFLLTALIAVAGFTAALAESLIAHLAWGRALGHFGRNAFVSAVATALGLGLGLSSMGTS